MVHTNEGAALTGRRGNQTLLPWATWPLQAWRSRNCVTTASLRATELCDHWNRRTRNCVTTGTWRSRNCRHEVPTRPWTCHPPGGTRTLSAGDNDTGPGRVQWACLIGGLYYEHCRRRRAINSYAVTSHVWGRNANQGAVPAAVGSLTRATTETPWHPPRGLTPRPTPTLRDVARLVAQDDNDDDKE